MRARLRFLFRVFGKGDAKIAAVFAQTSAAARHAVDHLHRGAPDIPIFLFCLEQPAQETAAGCARVAVEPGARSLFVRAQRELWPHWVAIGVAAWLGDRGNFVLKAAPFLVPPFRVLILNDNGDYFRGAPIPILRHIWNRLRGTFVGAVRNLLHESVERVWPYLLWVASRILTIGHFHGRLFAHIHGTESLDLPAPASSGDGVAVFIHRGLNWNGEALERFARAATARWILWRVAGGPEIAPPFQEPDTFAFSLQEHFRAWKPVMIPTAPFRALQAGEAAQVTAPLSETILVDRAKLLQLGVPRCGLAATAWMVLFWKASAAGWRSYSLGLGNALSEQPDFPVQETDFLTRAVLSNSLRRLGPREPVLGRGAVAFPAAHRNHTRRVSNRVRVLLVSPFLPYPLSHGGAVRIFNLCRHLKDRVEFSLVALRERGEHVDYDRLHEVFDQVHIVDIDERPAGDLALPEQVRGHRSAALEAVIAGLARSWRPDVLQVEYTHMAAFRAAAPGIPAILVEHDVTFALYRQLADSARTDEAEAEFRRWLDFEQHWLEAYESVWTVSPEDRRTAIREGRRKASMTFEVPNGVDITHYVPSSGDGGEILFVGSFRHLPNLLGFEKLYREVMPRVWMAHPEARLRVVAGPHPEQFRERLLSADPTLRLDPRIEVHSFIEDLRPFYARAAVVAVPLEVSAGTNIKVLEGMSCGKAIVTTPVGCAGLGLEDGREALVASDWSDFAGAVVRCLGDADLRRNLGLQARRAAETRFSWNTIADKALQSYERLLNLAYRVPAAGD